MPYLRYKLRSAGLGVPRTVVVEGETARFCSDVADELRREFPDALVLEGWDRSESADLYVYVVEQPPAKVPQQVLQRMAGPKRPPLIILDAGGRVAHVVPQNRGFASRLSVALDQRLARILRLMVRAEPAR
jgi:hypothetical protein